MYEHNKVLPHLPQFNYIVLQWQIMIRCVKYWLIYDARCARLLETIYKSPNQ